MKRTITCAILTLAAVLCSRAQTGDWSGKLDVYGNSLAVVFHFTADTASFDSPDQGAYGIAASIERSATGVKVRIPSINAVYEGLFLGNMIVGTLNQHGQSFPLTLSPGEIARRRPQTPGAPFPYTVEEVSFSNGEAVLSGTLVLPEGCSEATPALIMVTGSGLQNRDEEVFGHRPFAVIADALARHGIASLRYDDRSFGKSTGNAEAATTEDFKDDALAGIELLRKRFSTVGALGHSEGGTIVLMLAAEGRTDFAISLAGCAISGKETLIEQNSYALTMSGYSEEIRERYLRVLEYIFGELAAGHTPTLEAYGLPDELERNLHAVVAQGSSPWMRYFLSLDISASLTDIKCPILALNGTMDRQVDCDRNLSVLRERINAPKRICAIEGVNHLFQHCGSGDPSEYKEIEETFAPEVLDIISTWIGETCR